MFGAHPHPRHPRVAISISKINISVYENVLVVCAARHQHKRAQDYDFDSDDKAPQHAIIPNQQSEIQNGWVKWPTLKIASSQTLDQTLTSSKARIQRHVFSRESRRTPSESKVSTETWSEHGRDYELRSAHAGCSPNRCRTAQCLIHSAKHIRNRSYRASFEGACRVVARRAPRCKEMRSPTVKHRRDSVCSSL